MRPICSLPLGGREFRELQNPLRCTHLHRSVASGNIKMLSALAMKWTARLYLFKFAEHNFPFCEICTSCIQKLSMPDSKKLESTPQNKVIHGSFLFASSSSFFAQLIFSRPQFLSKETEEINLASEASSVSRRPSWGKAGQREGETIENAKDIPACPSDPPGTGADRGTLPETRGE